MKTKTHKKRKLEYFFDDVQKRKEKNKRKDIKRDKRKRGINLRNEFVIVKICSHLLI